MPSSCAVSEHAPVNVNEPKDSVRGRVLNKWHQQRRQLHNDEPACKQVSKQTSKQAGTASKRSTMAFPMPPNSTTHPQLRIIALAEKFCPAWTTALEMVSSWNTSWSWANEMANIIRRRDLYNKKSWHNMFHDCQANRSPHHSQSHSQTKCWARNEIKPMQLQ